MSFTQNVFHPRLLPAEGQYVYIYGSKGAVSLMGAPTLYRLSANAQPVVIGEKAQPDDPHAHIAAFYSAVLRGTPLPADITIGASAALTAILGHQAMISRTVVEWSSMGVAL